MFNFKNKRDNIKQLNNRMLSRTLSMFNYEGLPDTIPVVELEKQLQKNGFTFITEVEGELYAFYGGVGGEPDEYGNPTTITINNPALEYNATLDISDDGVFIKNDDLMLGMIDLFNRYNTMIAENEITMLLNNYNTRIQQLISAGDDKTKESADLYLKKVIDGELGIIGENRLFEGIKVQNAQANNSSVTTQLIEFHQYLRATLFNEIGLNANFNMKRERLNSSEVDMNIDSLYPFIDNMLSNRIEGMNKVNEMYDLDIGVEFGSIWQHKNRTDEEPTEEQISVITDEQEPTEDEQEPTEDEQETTEDEQEPIIEDDEMLEEAYAMNEEPDEEETG